MIHLEYHKKEQKLIGFNTFEIQDKTHYEFLGEVIIAPLNEKMLELDAPVARPRFGGFMYQMAGMLAKTEDKHICLTRSADIRDCAMAPMKKIWNNVGEKISSIEVPSEYNDEFYEYTDEDESPFLFEAFQIKETDGFKSSFKVIESDEHSIIPPKLLKEWNEFFHISYEMDTANQFINDDHPLRKEIDLSEHLSFKPKIKKQANRFRRN